MSYLEAGVDIDAGDRLVENIKPYARRTLRPEVLAGIGGFGALVELPKRFRDPVLVAGTDGDSPPDQYRLVLEGAGYTRPRRPAWPLAFRLEGQASSPGSFGECRV